MVFACQSRMAVSTVERMCPSPSLVHSSDAVFTPRNRTGLPALLSSCVPTTLSSSGSVSRLSWARAVVRRRNPQVARAIKQRFIVSDGPQDQAGVAAAEAKRVGHSHAHVMLSRLVCDQAQIDVGNIEIDCRRDGVVA